MWQNGPAFLILPRSLWPINQNLEAELPDKVGITMGCCTELENPGVDITVINIDRFSIYNKFLRVTSRVLYACNERSLCGMFKMPTADDLRRAELVWIQELQKDMVDCDVKYRRLGPAMKDGVIVVGLSISRWLKDNWNQENFILLPKDHPFTKLYVTHVHNMDHGGMRPHWLKYKPNLGFQGCAN